MNTQILEKLGLTPNEVRVYLSLLRLGESTTGPIIEESGIAASKIYITLDRLARKGLVSHAVKHNTKYFIAYSPEKLAEYQHEREQELMAERTELNTLIADLRQIYGTGLRKDTVQAFDGLRGIQSARERSLATLKKGELMWIIGISRSPYEGNLAPFFEEFHARRCKQGIKCRYLYNDYALDIAKKSAGYAQSEVRIMPKPLVTHSWIEIYGDTVTIGVNHRRSISIVIDNAEVAASFRTYAELLWGTGKPLKTM
jgi:HTH-type transcriptional regulator, sugar sensing transcriptional regulator